MATQQAEVGYEEKLGELESRSTKVGASFKSAADQSLELYRTMNERNQQEVAEQAEANLTRLQQSLAEYGEFAETVEQLTIGMTDDLEKHVVFAEQSHEYQGWERPVSWINRTYANALRLKRMEKQAPEKNLEHVVASANAAEQIVITNQTEAEAYLDTLTACVDAIVETIQEYEPKEREAKQIVDALEERYNILEEEHQIADSQRQAELVPEIRLLEKELLEARKTHTTYLTKYNQAQQHYAPIRQIEKDFAHVILAMQAQHTLIREKVKQEKPAFESVAPMIKYMMTTQGVETLDKTMNALLERTVRLSSRTRMAIEDSSLSRQEQEAIAEDKMNEILRESDEFNADARERREAIRARALRSLQDRYDLSEQS